MPRSERGDITGSAALRRWVAVGTSCALLTTTTLGCAGIKKVSRRAVARQDLRTAATKKPFLKSHMRDGSLYVFKEWSVTRGDSAVEGEADRLDVNRNVQMSGRFVVPIDSVVLFESNVVQTSPAVGVYTVMLGITVIGTIICITNPKSCFGSCPTTYWEDGPANLVQAESFSNSVAPCLEETDVDALYRVRPTGRTLRMRVTNEAHETHVIRTANILAAILPEGGRVARDASGELRQIFDPRPPVRAAAPEGDCAQSFSAFDGHERFSVADSSDLGTRETIDLEFTPRSSDSLGIVIATRQTLLTTYLLYQSLAFMGRSAPSWIANLERQDPFIQSMAGGLGRELGGIEVLVPDGRDGWIAAGEAGETGPIATDVYLVRLPPTAAGVQHVRLRMARGAWRVDYVALASVGASVTPLRVSPSRVTRAGSDDVSALRALTGGPRPLMTLPGDAYILEYPLPEAPERYEYFLEARGYYLEWLRDSWMSEENLVRANQIFLDPRGALRAIAPEFKRVEPEMEALFWASRYVRN